MFSLLLVCADLNTLHAVKNILNEEECRRVGKAGLWWDDELAVIIVVKQPGVVQETLGVLKGGVSSAAKPVKSKLCSIW